MATIAVMTVSDGRPYVHLEIESFGLDVQQRIARALGGLGHRVVTADGRHPLERVTAVAVARELAAARPDLTIVNVPVWAFPHFTMLAVRETPGAVVLFSNIDPQYPGMVGMLAAGGGLDQIGRQHERAWGDIEDPAGAAPARRPRPRRRGGQRPARLDVRPRSAAGRWACTPRCPPPTSGCRSSASTSRRSTSTSWCTGPPRCRTPRSARPATGSSSTPPRCTTTGRG